MRSLARKSGRWIPTSAFTTPTSVTRGKSSPLAIICVPRRMSTSPRSTRARMRWWAHLPDVVSTSMRAMRASGNVSAVDALHLLRPQPAEGQVLGAAARAPRGRRLLVAAVVADEPLRDAGGTSARWSSSRSAATSPHSRHWTKAEYPRRLRSRMTCSRRRRRASTAATSSSQRTPPPRAGRRSASPPRAALQVDARAPRAGGRPRPAPEGAACRNFPVRGVVPALQRRRGAPQDAHRAVGLGAHDRQVPGLVAGRLRLLVAAVVLLVHHHGAQALQRREERRAGPHGDAARARAELTPGVVALAVGEAGVEHRDLVAEVGPEARHRLRRERDLRHQDEGGAPPGQRRAQQLDVDQRLPRARHALEEEGRGARLVQRRHQRVEGRPLVGRRREVRRRRRRARRRRGRASPPRRPAVDQPLGLQPRDDAPAEARLAGEVGELHAAARRLEELVRLPLTPARGRTAPRARPGPQLPGDAHDPPGLHRRLRRRHGLVGEHAPVPAATRISGQMDPMPSVLRSVATRWGPSAARQARRRAAAPGVAGPRADSPRRAR